MPNGTVRSSDRSWEIRPRAVRRSSRGARCRHGWSRVSSKVRRGPLWALLRERAQSCRVPRETASAASWLGGKRGRRAKASNCLTPARAWCWQGGTTRLLWDRGSLTRHAVASASPPPNLTKGPGDLASTSGRSPGLLRFTLAGDPSQPSSRTPIDRMQYLLALMRGMCQRQCPAWPNPRERDNC